MHPIASRGIRLIVAVLLLATPALAGEASPDQVVDRYLAAYAAGDVAALAALYAEDTTFVDVSQRHEVKGKAAMAESLAGLAAIHKAMDIEEKRRARNGNLVTVEVVYSGTLDCAALGRPDHPDLVYRLPAVLLFEVDGGRIASQTDYLDFRTFTENFAALQAPPTSAAEVPPTSGDAPSGGH